MFRIAESRIRIDPWRPQLVRLAFTLHLDAIARWPYNPIGGAVC